MALTELKSILSNFRKPMAVNPLAEKGKDKTNPVIPSQQDQTTTSMSKLSPKDTDKSSSELSNTKFKSDIKTIKLGVFDSFKVPQLLNTVSPNKNETSNVKITDAANGTFNTTSNIKVTPADIGTNNLTSDVKVTPADIGTNNLTSPTNTTPAEVGTNNLVSPTKTTPATQGTNNLTSPTNTTPAAVGTNNLTSPTNTISVVQDKLLKIINSGLNIDGTPVTYTVSNQLIQDNSILNLGTPTVYDGQTKLTADISNQNIDYVPPKYIVMPSLLQFGTNGPGLSNNASTIDIDSIPNRYQNIVNLGQFNPFNNAQSLLDINSVPTKYQNTIGLGQFNPFNNAQSLLDINSIPTQYRNIVELGQFNPENPGQSLLNIDGNLTKYTNIVGNGQFNNDSTIVGNRWSGTVPPAVNFFKPDAIQGAKGFTVDMTTTQFETVSGLSYGYTNTIQKPLANGIAKLEAQLGVGSIFYYSDAGAIKTKPFTVAGYNASNRYGDIVKSNKSNPNDSLLYKVSTEENSPSAIDLQYAKFNLQDDSYNPWYIPQPYVLRGPQRKGNKGLQRWGGSALADDGLIRGGFATAAERSAFDLVRLGQWIASPKGLLWVVKQVGLGLSNPFVQSIIPDPGSGVIGQTRIHTGITSLLSVPTTAFGLHFTRHGLPGLNAIDDYEFVQRSRNLTATYDLPSVGNRLVTLHSRLISTNLISVGPTLERPLYDATSFGGVAPGQLFGANPLGRFGGPNSVYGIGFTSAKRFVNTTSASNPLSPAILSTIDPILGLAIYAKTYNINTPYTDAYGINSAVELPPGESPSITKTDYKSPLQTAGENKENPTSTLLNPRPDPFKRKPDISSKGSSDPTIDTGPKLGIKAYQTVAYNKIPADGSEVSQDGGFLDFRKKIGKSDDNQPFLGDFERADYKNKNLEKFGWGEHGAIGAEKNDYTKPTLRGDKVNLIDYQKLELSDKLAKGDYGAISNSTKDFIAFYFAGPNHHIGSSDDVMIFRANIQGFSDSFSPDWSPINIMGRADKAYIYTGFDRSISFTFTAAATSREEMKPMWRKLNYLATYTMPDYNKGGRLLGPFMRLTIGNLFQNTPGFIESLSISIPDDATWELGAIDTQDDMKQLPMMAEVSVTFKVLADYRPQKNGRAYSLSKLGKEGGDTSKNWLTGPELDGSDTNIDETNPKAPESTTK